MTLEIQNLTARKIDQDLIKKIIHTTIQFEDRDKNGIMSMSVALVGRARMQTLNRMYYKENKATDVLSFSGGKDFIAPKSWGEYLGEIILCPTVIQKRASRAGVDFKQEFAHMLIHGTLHLLGYNHEGSVKAAEDLHAKEEKIISIIFSG